VTQRSPDRFLGGRIEAQQFLNGFRSGTDAVMLAAAIPAQDGEELLELGTGAGVASLCVAARATGCRISGLDISQELVELAQENARANSMENRISFAQADVFDLPERWRRDFHHVFCNPPFHGADGLAPPNEARALALQDDGQLGNWLTTGMRRVRAGGTFTAIIRADRLQEALTVLPPVGVTVFPLWPREGEPAKRIILQVNKNSRAPMMLVPGLILHEKDGRYTQAADAILRGSASLALASPRR
jgi:tRNA1(Val) A37 N6-methylase TrmN6